MNSDKTVPRPLVYSLLGLLVLVDGLLFLRSPGDFDRFLINALLALSVFVTLHAKLLSLASAGFMAIGAYTSAILVVKMGLPLGISLPVSVILCAVIALIIGLPVLKLNDVYLAIATLGFGEVVRVLIILTPDLTGGPTGANLSTGFAYESMKQTQTWMLLLFMALLIYLFIFMSKSRTGRAFRAIRENPSAAKTMGINVVYQRNLAFVLSAMIAGAAGVFYAHNVGSLDSSDFKFSRAVDILSYAVLGGAGHWLGPILGAGILTTLPILLRDLLGSTLSFLKTFAQLPNILNGLALMLAIVFLPGGLVAIKMKPWKKRKSLDSVPEVDTLQPSEQEGKSALKPGDTLLKVDNVCKSFGGVGAVSNVSFEVHKGEVVGLIGPNGAGKTTMLNMISGLYKTTSGKIYWIGRDIHSWGAHYIAKAGIGRTYQNIQLFSEMTVLENVIVGHHSHVHTSLLTTWLRLPVEFKEEKSARAKALSILNRLGLSEFADLPAGKLSYGDQRRVEIARALALEPKLLLLDEPAAGMNEVETEKLAQFILELKKSGLTILVIEHHMELIMKVSDQIVVLNFGKKIAQGDPAQVSKDEEVLTAYLGRD